MKNGSLVAGITVVELRARASSACRVAVLTESERVHVLAHLTYAGAVCLQDCERLAFPAVGGERAAASVAGVVTRLASSGHIEEVAYIALAAAVRHS